MFKANFKIIYNDFIFFLLNQVLVLERIVHNFNFRVKTLPMSTNLHLNLIPNHVVVTSHHRKRTPDERIIRLKI